MGKLFYGTNVAIEFEDRVLAHLQLVIAAKLRQRESMLFSWRDNADGGEGRTAIWIQPDADLVFHYHSGHRPTINRQWLELLMLEANKPGGLQLVEEPETDDGVPEGHCITIRPNGSGLA